MGCLATLWFIAYPVLFVLLIRDRLWAAPRAGRAVPSLAPWAVPLWPGCSGLG